MTAPSHPGRLSIGRGHRQRRHIRTAATLGLLSGVLAATAPLAAHAASMSPAVVSTALTAQRVTSSAPAAIHAAVTAVDSSRQNTTLVVLDTSGSMKDDVGVAPGSVSTGTGGAAAHQSKIDAARTAIVELIYGLPSGTNYGLLAYPSGPSTIGGCQGTKLITRLGKLNPTSAMTGVRRLSAEGGTPTAPALRQAALLLSSRGQDGGTIVLVSDGIANCGGDPCDVAKELHQKDIDLQVHVVGFDVDAATDTSLGCIARETGGKYVSVSDPTQLVAAIAAASRPQLALAVRAPTTTVPPTYTGNGQSVTLAVTNTGTRPAMNVRATFTVTGNGRSSTVTPAVRYLGNIAPSASGTVTFTARLSAEAGTTQTWRAATISDFATDTSQTGTFTVAETVSPDSLTGPLAGVKRVIVVGDSYSSGEGGSVPGTSFAAGKDAYDLKTYGPDADANNCHRSKYTYGRAIWGSNATVIACSGAVTGDFYRSQNSGQKDPPPQLKALRNKALDPATTPDAVLLTLGGNDVGFVPTIARCTLQPTCYEDLGRDIDWTVFDALENRLVETYDDIDRAVNDERALAARGGRAIPIIVLPYVRGIPRGGVGDSLPGGCQTKISGRDLAFLNTFLTRLNSTVLGAVTQRHKAGRPVYLASDVEDAFLPGHTICEKTGSYLNYYDGSLLKYPGGEIRQEMLHPNIAGYAAESFALASWSATAKVIPATRAVPYGSDNTDPDLSTRFLASVGSLAHEAGGNLTRTSVGWAPGSTVSWVLASTPRLLGTSVADGHGTVHLDGQIPVDVPPGEHHLTEAGFGADGSVRRVVEAVTVRRRGVVLAWATIAAGFLLPAMVFVRVRRRLSLRP